MSDNDNEIEAPSYTSLFRDIENMDKALETFHDLDNAGQQTMKAAHKAQTLALCAIARAMTIQAVIDADVIDNDSPLPFPVGMDHQCACGGVVFGRDRGPDGLIPCSNCGHRFDTITGEQVEVVEGVA